MLHHVGFGLLLELELGPIHLLDLLKLSDLSFQVLFSHQVVSIPVVLLMTIMDRIAWYDLYHAIKTCINVLVNEIIETPGFQPKSGIHNMHVSPWL